MENRGARVRAFMAQAGGLDERYSGYRAELTRAALSVLGTYNDYGTDTARRAAIEQSMRPIATKLNEEATKGNP